MADTTHTSTSVIDGVLDAKIKFEKLTEREGPIIVDEITANAPGAGWKIALDITDVSFIASAGIGAIVTLHKQAKANGGKLAVYGVSDDILQLLKLTRLNKLFTIAKDKDAAIKALK